MEWMVDCKNTNKETSNSDKETNNIISLCRDKINRMKIIEKNTDQPIVNFTAHYCCDKNRTDLKTGKENIHRNHQIDQSVVKFNKVIINEPPCNMNDTKRSNKSTKNVMFKVKCVPEFTTKKPCVLPKGLPIYKNDSVDFDNVLLQLGEFGRYQKILFLSMLLFAFSEAFVYFAQIFITVVPDHWCRVPEISHLHIEQRKRISIPRKDDNTFDSCSMYSVNYTELLVSGLKQADPNWPIQSCQNGWDYDFSVIPYASIATELNWVCDQGTLSTLAQAIFFCGAIVGGFLFGWVSDRYGRVHALVLTNLVGFIFGTITAFSTNFWQFAICRFFVGLAFDNCFTMMYIIVLEYVGPTWRTFVANMSIAVFFSLAESLLPWIAYYIANWKWFCVVTSLPLFAGVLVASIVPESARWLVSQERVEEAVIIMKKFEKVNGKKVDPKLYQQLRENSLRLANEKQEQTRLSVLDLFRTPRLRNVTTLLIVIWMAMSLLFDGHVRQVEHLGLDFFLTFTLASATELPADTLLTVTLDRWGRRWYACVTLLFSGVFSLMSCSVETGKLSVGLALIGRFLVNISYNIGLQYSAEVLPTVVRGQGIALIHIMGFVASILSPFIVHLSVIAPMLPLAVLGIVGILAGVLCLFLPETMGQDLPQTLQDFENFGRTQKFFEFPCFRGRRSDEEDNKVQPYIATKIL